MIQIDFGELGREQARHFLKCISKFLHDSGEKDAASFVNSAISCLWAKDQTEIVQGYIKERDSLE